MREEPRVAIVETICALAVTKAFARRPLISAVWAPATHRQDEDVRDSDCNDANEEVSIFVVESSPQNIPESHSDHRNGGCQHFLCSSSVR